MPVRELTKPKSVSSRRSKYPFSSNEIKEAIKMLKAGKTPGVGPYEGDKAIREARSAAQSLSRHIQEVEPDMSIGTSAWEDENGDAYALIKLRD